MRSIIHIIYFNVLLFFYLYTQITKRRLKNFSNYYINKFNVESIYLIELLLINLSIKHIYSIEEYRIL